MMAVELVTEAEALEFLKVAADDVLNGNALY